MIKNYHDTGLIIHDNLFIKTSKALEAEKYLLFGMNYSYMGPGNCEQQVPTIINKGKSDASIRKTKSRKAPQNMPAIPDDINEC